MRLTPAADPERTIEMLTVTLLLLLLALVATLAAALGKAPLWVPVVLLVVVGLLRELPR
jgi:hypothetical protein